jgi:NTP pyrophosphatase (non-canonical NTP hydrolase)
VALADYQKRVDTELRAYEKPYWHPLSQLARIVEEAGEVARILNHKYGDKPKKSTEEHGELSDELADIIFSVVCLANSEGIELDPALDRALNKLTIRDKDRFERKEP